MGQHKRNPVAIAAKKGELPPKKPKMSKADRDRWIYARCMEAVYQSLGVPHKYLGKVGASDGL